MKITHLSNSFITVSAGGARLACDPWAGKANAGGWQSFPEFGLDTLSRELADVQWVYLSHLHDDHFHPDTLRASGLLDREFIIKRFDAPVLRERLKRLGVQRIHEVDPFEVRRFGPFEMAIIPQMTSNSSGLEDGVNFDMDTSIAIKADGVVFFNQVDNPLSLEDLQEIRGWIGDHLGPVDVACLMSGAASEYPHLFLDIDQAGEKKRIVDRALDDLVRWLQVLSPRCYFPAGGTYLIPGPLGVFNPWIAQPDFEQIRSTVESSGLAVKAFNIEGGHSLSVTPLGLNRTDGSLSPLDSTKEAAAARHLDDPYPHEELAAPSRHLLGQLLAKARENWQAQVRQANLQITQALRLEIYEHLTLTEHGRPAPDAHLDTFEIHSAAEASSGQLTIHVDHRALWGCLTRKFSWNAVLGSLCLFERHPNRHHPTDVFSINHLALTRDQLQAFEVTERN